MENGKLKIYVCIDCPNGSDLYQRLSGSVREGCYDADVVRSVCLKGCNYPPRVNVKLPTDKIVYYGSQSTGSIRDLGKDPVRTVIEDNLPRTE